MFSKEKSFAPISCQIESLSNFCSQWTGLLIEPNARYFSDLLLKHRNAWSFAHCLSTKKHPEVVLYHNAGPGSGIINSGKSKNGDINLWSGSWVQIPPGEDFFLYEKKLFSMSSVSVSVSKFIY